MLFVSWMKCIFKLYTRTCNECIFFKLGDAFYFIFYLNWITHELVYWSKNLTMLFFFLQILANFGNFFFMFSLWTWRDRSFDSYSYTLIKPLISSSRIIIYPTSFEIPSPRFSFSLLIIYSTVISCFFSPSIYTLCPSSLSVCLSVSLSLSLSLCLSLSLSISLSPSSPLSIWVYSLIFSW